MSARIRPSERRRFLKLVGLAGLSAAVGTAMTSRAEPRPPDRSAPTHPSRIAPPDTTRPPVTEAPPISDDARALAEIVKRRYGKHLEPAQFEAVTREIEFRLQGGKRLREARLANSDEPDSIFRA